MYGQTSFLWQKMQFKNLITPVIIVIFTSITLLAGTIVYFAERQDRDAANIERQIFEAAMGQHAIAMYTVAEDNAWWDEAVQKMFFTEDAAWLDANFGDTIYGIANIDVILVLRPDNSIMFSEISEQLGMLAADILTPPLMRAVAALEPTSEDTGITNGGFVQVGGRLFAVGVSMVQSTKRHVYDPPISNMRKPVIIIAREITQERLKEVASIKSLDTLAFSTDPFEQHSYSVEGIIGSIIGFYQWQPLEPGTQLLKQLVWPAALLLTLAALVLVYFVVQARRMMLGITQADRAKSQFLASMSHEVRTPLNAILGFSEMMALELYGKIEGEKNHEYLKIIRRSGEHLLSIINDILDLSKLEAGRFEANWEYVSPDFVIGECLRMMSGIAADKNITLVNENLPARLLTDERIMRQCLINILSNAIKFTPEGGRIFVRGSQNRRYYTITVADNGVGMTQEEIQIALTPFGQAHKGGKDTGVGTQQQGTGLGLPIVERFMQLVGGNMHLRSVPQHGTSVSLNFPIKS